MSNSNFLDHDIRSLTIGRVLADRAAGSGDKCCLHDLRTGRRYSYAEVDALSNRWARGLAEQGVTQGAHVAVMVDNCAEQLLLYFALGKLGAVVVPINTAARGSLLAYSLDHADVTVLIADVALLERIADIALPQLRQVIALDPFGTGQSAPPRLQALPFAAVTDCPDARPLDAASFRDPAFIAFTSGTTGPSKGIVISQAAMMLGALNYARSYGYRADDVYYVCLPLFHASAIRAGAYLTLMAGGTIALTRKFSVSRFWEEVRLSGATTFNLLGSMANFLWSAPVTDEDRDHAIRFCRMAPVPPFARAFEERFGLRVVSAYGLTDVGVPAAYTLEHPRDKLGSCGRARAGWQIRVVDEDDFDVPQGETGEIVLRCDIPWHTASGYYKRPEETLRLYRNGWYHTGDQGYLDADGFLYFADRKKDALRRRGENISAWEVEQILLRHPAVQDAAVFAVKARTSEDEVAAAIVLREGARLEAAGLIDFCAANMAPYMVPRYLQFLDRLPLNASQKVEKAVLRQRAAEAPETLWDREAPVPAATQARVLGG